MLTIIEAIGKRKIQNFNVMCFFFVFEKQRFRILYSSDIIYATFHC